MRATIVCITLEKKTKLEEKPHTINNCIFFPALTAHVPAYLINEAATGPAGLGPRICLHLSTGPHALHKRTIVLLMKRITKLVVGIVSEGSAFPDKFHNHREPLSHKGNEVTVGPAALQCEAFIFVNHCKLNLLILLYIIGL